MWHHKNTVIHFVSIAGEIFENLYILRRFKLWCEFFKSAPLSCPVPVGLTARWAALAQCYVGCGGYHWGCHTLPNVTPWFVDSRLATGRSALWNTWGVPGVFTWGRIRNLLMWSLAWDDLTDSVADADCAYGAHAPESRTGHRDIQRLRVESCLIRRCLHTKGMIYSWATFVSWCRQKWATLSQW